MTKEQEQEALTRLGNLAALLKTLGEGVAKSNPSHITPVKITILGERLEDLQSRIVADGSFTINGDANIQEVNDVFEDLADLLPESLRNELKIAAMRGENQ